jgi:chromosome segregation protein
LFLSKLEIFGFKSFANRTPVVFNRGITGIVGPNGCGKTNIVDAIRWVLGEQKSATLRSDKMENVIFNGTRNKKPMGMAEVSLTLVNDRGILPTEYSEVTITRRIFRSGESEYLLNKNVCRLKDITNLFMDTGMGTNAYSVIELKMIETILSSKAEERRKLFEEAAGVNKYKLRRRLSLKKLDEVKADLTRVNDIVAEVEKAVRSLERQAKRADQYSQIQSSLREKEVDLAEREFSLFNEKKESLKIEIVSLTAEKEEIDVDIRKIENELIVYRNQINTIEAELREKRGELSANTNQLHQTQKNISVSEEKLNSFIRNHDRLEREIAELKEQLEDNEFTIEENKSDLVLLNQKLETKEKEISENEGSIQEKRELLGQKRGALKQHTEERFNLLKEISQKENYIASLKKEVGAHNANIEKLNQKIQNITNTIAKTVGFVEDLSQEKVTAEKKLNETGLLLTLRETEKADLERELNELKGKEIEEKTLLNGLKEKIEFLQTLLANLEGISKGTKNLIENSDWTQNQKSIFADAGNTQEQYRFALEAALKSVLNNLLVENSKDLESAIEYLRSNDLGKASFYLLRNNSELKKSFIQKLSDYSFKRKIKKLEKESGFIGWAKDYVETDAALKPFFDQALANVVVTSDLNTAISFGIKYPEINFATLDGDIISGNGIIEAGSLPKQDETLFGRRQLLENLKKEFPKHEANIDKLKNQIAETEEIISGIDLKNLSDSEKLIANDIANIEKQISQLEFEKKKGDEEISDAQKEIQEHVDKSGLLDSQINEVDEQTNALKVQLIDLNKFIVDQEKENRALESEFNSSVETHNENKLEFERLKGQINNTNDSIVRSENNRVTIKNGIEKRNNDLASNESETNVLQEIIEDTRQELVEINLSRETLTKQENEIDNKLKSIKQEASKFEKSLSEFRNRRQEVSDRIHSLDIKDNEINFKLETIVKHIQENYSIELELKQFEDLHTFGYDEVTSEVQHLKEKIRSLGPVNLLAYSEYEEEKTRLDFLHKQRDDLTESEKDLIKTISEINETAQKLFLDTFSQIRENFINIFQGLFNPGDEADLILEENADPLEAKIEIMAKPKGKRPTSIELLSGGEKTLTATALLFAIYLVKPSPFCILDEVDAPLDDANVDRFTKLIKEFSVKTQFIIVTHNKRTMEASETMYGVTIQEEGVSKLVGVRFEEIPDTIAVN